MTALFNLTFSQIINTNQPQPTKHTQLLNLVLSFISQQFTGIEQSGHQLFDFIKQQQLEEYDRHIHQIKDANAKIGHIVKTFYEYIRRYQNEELNKYKKYFNSKVQKLNNKNIQILDQKIQKQEQQVNNVNDYDELIRQLNKYDSHLPIYRTAHCIYTQSLQKLQDIPAFEKDLNLSIKSAIHRMLKSTISDLQQYTSSFAFAIDANSEFSEIMNIIKNQYLKIRVDQNMPTIQQLNNMKELCLTVKAKILGEKKRIMNEEMQLKGQNGHSHHTNQHHHYRK